MTCAVADGIFKARESLPIAKLLDHWTHVPVEPEKTIDLTIEYEQEDDGRWLAEVLELPGVLAYGQTQKAATAHAQALALRVLVE